MVYIYGEKLKTFPWHSLPDGIVLDLIRILFHFELNYE